MAALLNERLLIEGEANAEAGVPQASSFLTRKRVVLALLAVVGVACLVVGSVAASGAFTRSSPAASSSGAQSFSVVDPSLLQRRPNFTAPIGSLANAPQPKVIASNDKTETATLDFKHSHVTPQGHISHTQLTYTVTKHRNAHCPAKHESVLAIDCLPNRIRISFTNASKAREYGAATLNSTVLVSVNKSRTTPRVVTVEPKSHVVRLEMGLGEKLRCRFAPSRFSRKF
jgi:hypothetical protein